jgi:kynurenine formamidase
MESLLGKDFIFMALPLKIKNGEGSPIRAVAMIME